MDKRKPRNIDFGSGSMASIIIRQALPLTASQLAGLIYNIVDRIFIGHIPDVGSDALSGLGLTLPIVALINAFTLLMGQGGSPVFSMARGAGKDDKAAKVLGNSFLMLSVTAVILTLTGYLFMKPVIYFFGGSDNTYVYAFDYLKIYLAGTFFQMLATGLSFYITAQGHPGV
ncbi:MAG: MATE family efflux transporter, partial [Clostridiales bacterium]|nr:MATE family efflux transporter [Clostridiales bacterium]